MCALVRNDMLKTVACQRLQGRFPAAPRQCPQIMQTRGKFMDVIARSEATWQSVLFAAAQNEKQHLGRIRSSLRVRLKCYFSLPFPAGRTDATPVCALVRNDMLKTVACQRLQGRGAQGARKTCRVSAGARHRFAMTCKRLSRCYVCKRVPPGQARTAHEFALSVTFSYLSLRGERIATPVCALVRNDMLKTVACQRLQGRGAQGARKHAGCQRGQGTGSQ